MGRHDLRKVSGSLRKVLDENSVFYVVTATASSIGKLYYFSSCLFFFSYIIRDVLDCLGRAFPSFRNESIDFTS